MKPPKYAKNNVLVVVPKISLPIFIPELNSSFTFNFGFVSCNSYRAEDIAIDVSFIVPISPINIIQLDSGNISRPVLYIKYPTVSIVSSVYPWIYILFPSINVIMVNTINIRITDINDDIVFLLYPFKKNKIIVLIIIHIIRVGIVGLNPQPVIITNINSNVKFI